MNEKSFKEKMRNTRRSQFGFYALITFIAIMIAFEHYDNRTVWALIVTTTPIILYNFYRAFFVLEIKEISSNNIQSFSSDFKMFFISFIKSYILYIVFYPTFWMSVLNDLFYKKDFFNFPLFMLFIFHVYVCWMIYHYSIKNKNLPYYNKAVRIGFQFLLVLTPIASLFLNVILNSLPTDFSFETGFSISLFFLIITPLIAIALIDCIGFKKELSEKISDF